MWSSPDVVGLFSNNVVSFSSNVVLRGLLFSINLVSKPRMLSVRGDYVLSSLHLGTRRLRQAVPVQCNRADNNQALDDILPDVGYTGKDQPIG